MLFVLQKIIIMHLIILNAFNNFRIIITLILIILIKKWLISIFLKLFMIFNIENPKLTFTEKIMILTIINIIII